MHLDVCRHFFSVKEVCKFIDLIALHRFNIFHWHLTEDQGWRIEIKRYPKLTKIGSKRKCTLIGHESDRPRQFDNTTYSGFYTQEDIRFVVDYAAQRCITIVPEIDMPGHMQAVITAYPELGNYPERQLELRCHWGISQNILNLEPSTVTFMQNVLEELIQLFPSKFIHLGGDEALKHEWMESFKAQKRMAELGLKSEDELQSWFMKQMDDFLTSKGRKLIGWDEILEEGLASGAAVMSWRNADGGLKAAEAGHDAVMSVAEYTYFDSYQNEPVKNEPLAIGGMLPMEKVLEFNPIPDNLSEDKKNKILGGQGQLWTEYIANYKHLEYMAFPRVCALSEILWKNSNKILESEFKEHLNIHLQRLDALDVNYKVHEKAFRTMSI